jgi:hypothetical protein
MVINSGNNTSSCGRDGIDLSDVVSVGTIAGNTLTDTRGGGSKTQQYGVYAYTGCFHSATLTNVRVDESNQTVGNAVGAYGGGLTGPTTWTPVHASAIGSCAAANKGRTQNVDDASSPTYLGTLTGSSSNAVRALCNGSAWVAD